MAEKRAAGIPSHALGKISEEMLQEYPPYFQQLWGPANLFAAPCSKFSLSDHTVSSLLQFVLQPFLKHLHQGCFSMHLCFSIQYKGI